MKIAAGDKAWKKKKEKEKSQKTKHWEKCDTAFRNILLMLIFTKSFTFWIILHGFSQIKCHIHVFSPKTTTMKTTKIKYTL